MKQSRFTEEQTIVVPDVGVRLGQPFVNGLLPAAVKITIGLFAADFLSVLFMNTLRLPSYALPWVFVAAFGAVTSWVYRSGGLPNRPPELLSALETSWLVGGLLLLALIYSGVRLHYALEMPLHHLVNFIGDDSGHVQEINSLANSARYPAQSSFDPSMYFSMYYAPWMLAAAIYRAIPVPGFTIKTALFLCNTVYLFLIPMTLADIAMRLARTRGHFYWACYWIVCWSGIEGLVALVHPLRHNGWWMTAFGLDIQFSNYSIVCIWVILHLSAAIALVVSWYLWRDRLQPQRAFNVAVCSLLAAYAFYSSIFVCLGALPIALVVLIGSRGMQARLGAAISAVSSALAAPLLWLHTRKPVGVGFLIPLWHPRWIHFGSIFHEWPNLRFGPWKEFAVFLALLVASFPFVPWALSVISASRERISKTDKALVVVTVAFLISTYFVGFSVNGNYAMRGAIVPIIVLAWICSRNLPPIKLSAGVIAILVVGSLGSAQEIAFNYNKEIRAITEPPLQSINTGEILRVNQDRHSGAVNSSEIDPKLRRSREALFHLEKLPSEVVEPVNQVDRGLENFGPCGPWEWQQNPEIRSKPCPE